MMSVDKQELRTQIREREAHAAAQIEEAELQKWVRRQYQQFGRVP